MRIKQEHRVILFASLSGAFLWLLDAFLDKFDKYPNVPFIRVLLLDTPSHEFWLRPIFVFSFTIFGLLIAHYMQKGRFLEGRYHNLSDSINDIIMVKPLTGQIEKERLLEVNPAASQKLGYAKEELLQMSMVDLVDPKRLPELPKIAETLRTRGRISYETDLLTKGGNTISAEVSSHIVDINGNPRVFCVMRDISERKRNESEILRLASFPRLNPNPILEVDANGAITFANDACCEIAKKLGTTEEAFLPPDIREILQLAVRQGSGQFRRQVQINDSLFSEFIYYTAEFNMARVYPVEITDHFKAETCLRESERQLRLLTARLLEVQENERTRISKELHDELGQALMFLKLQLSSVMDHLRIDQGELRQECAGVLASVDVLIENIRRLVTDFSPAALEELGLTSAIKLLLEEFAKHYNINTDMVNFDNVDQLFPPAVRLGIYRVFQESLTNIGKHAKATRVSCTITYQGSQVLFSIKDNGRGFNLEKLNLQEGRPKGIGLNTMIERVRLAGGQMDIKSRARVGTEITFTIPVRSEKESEDGL